MKRLIFLIAAVLIATVQLYSQWVQQPSPTFSHLNSIFILNQNTLFVAGDSGVILKTSNSGGNWIKSRQSTFHWHLNGIWFQNENTGIAVGGVDSYPRVGIIFRTTNGGNSWDSLVINGIYFRVLYFLNANTGFAGGWSMNPSSSPIYKTTNAGLNWQPITPFNAFGIENFCFLNEHQGFATGDIIGSEVVFKTEDGGNNWSILSSFSIQYTWLCSVMFVNENIGWITGWSQIPINGSLLKKTTDGGTTWVDQTHNSTNLLYEQVYLNENTGWVVGEPQLIQKTTNGGKNWVLQTSPPAWWMFDVKFLNENTGWIAGSQGKIFHTTNGGAVSVQNISTEVPSAYSLSQNYPNPFNPRTKIRFGIKKSEFRSQNSEVTLKIYDALGREVETLINDQLAPGTYEVTFDGTRLNSGVYFYKLTTEGFSETKRMLMIK